jgi:MFS transporter, DHA3 family, macrolide efflux protein
MIYRLNLKEKLKSYTSEYKPLLNNRSLIMLVSAGIISSFGSKITYFALLRKVYTVTEGKIASLGALTVFEILPSIIFGAIAGFIIDKISRKWSMVVSDILSGVTILTVIFIQDIKLIYLIAFLNASVNVFRVPAQRAFEPNLVEKENIPLLNSFNSFANNFTQIVGAATGAAIVGFVGVNIAFIIDAITFWTSAVIITTIGAKENHLEVRGKQIKAKAVGLK